MAPRSEDPKLIIHLINFELVQPIYSRYINVTDGQTHITRPEEATTFGGKNSLPNISFYVANRGYFSQLMSSNDPWGSVSRYKCVTKYLIFLQPQAL